jgi:hypothetical protein
MTGPHEDEHQRTADPVPSIPPRGDEQSRQPKQLRQDAQDAELDAQLVRKDGRSREVRRGGGGSASNPLKGNDVCAGSGG